MHRQGREATSDKTRCGGVCLFVNNSWCEMSNIKDVSMYCSPEVEHIMKNCSTNYLPREFSSILFVAVYLPPQTDAPEARLQAKTKAGITNDSFNTEVVK